MTWTCWHLRSIVCNFSQASSFVRATAVFSATFRRDLLLLLLLNPCHKISAVTAVQATAQLNAASLLRPE